MSDIREPGGARAGSRERPDLRQLYRPIGIGAVAAALSVTGEPRAGAGGSPAAPKEERRHARSLAA